MEADEEKTLLADCLSAGLERSRVRRWLLLAFCGVLVAFFGVLFTDREAQAKQKGDALGGGASSLKEAAGSGADPGGSGRSHGSGPLSAPSTSKPDSASTPVRDQASERTSRPALEPTPTAETVTKPVSRADEPVVDPATRTIEPALKTADTISAQAVEMAEPTVGSVGTSIEPVRRRVEQQVEPIREAVEPVVSPVAEAIEPLAGQGSLPIEVAPVASEPLSTELTISEPVASVPTAPEPVVEWPPVVGADLGVTAADPVRETVSLVAENSEDSVVLGNATSTPPEPPTNSPASLSQPVVAPPASGAEEHATEAFSSSSPTAEDQGMTPDRILIGYHPAPRSLSQVEQAPSQAPQQPIYPGPTAPTGTGSSLHGSGFEPYNGLGAAVLALLLILSPAGVRLLRSSREILRPDSALSLAVERPG